MGSTYGPIATTTVRFNGISDGYPQFATTFVTKWQKTRASRRYHKQSAGRKDKFAIIYIKLGAIVMHTKMKQAEVVLSKPIPDYA